MVDVTHPGVGGFEHASSVRSAAHAGRQVGSGGREACHDGRMSETARDSHQPPTDLLPGDDLRSLADAFRAADFTVDAVAERLGPQAMAALGRNTTVAAVRALGRQDDPQASLLRLFVLQRACREDAVRRALGDWVDRLRTAGLIDVASGRVRAAVDIRPYGSDESVGLPVDGWLVSDHVPGLDGVVTPTRPDFVLGASSASVTLARMTIREPVGRALDLGAGCGVQSLHLAGHADRVVATDLNSRALALAGLTLRLNGIADRVERRYGSLWEPVAGERFDLIVSNPPYVISPPEPASRRLVYRAGTLPADRLVAEVVGGAVDHLAPGGTLQILGNWAHTAGCDWTERLAEWIRPTGCDALVLQREVLDPHEYIELWLTDAGLAGSPAWLGRYADWLDYFDRLGIEAVGMGWIILHRAGHTEPTVRMEDWPHTVPGPVGPALVVERRGVAAARRADADLLEARWRLVDCLQETYGAPGAADPERIVIRQRSGFGRAVAVGTELAAVLGACDGELPLGIIIAAVADLLDVPAERREELRDGLLARFRGLLVDGFAEVVD